MKQNTLKFKCNNLSRHFGYSNPKFIADDEKCMATQMYIVKTKVDESNEVLASEAKNYSEIRNKIINHLCEKYPSISVNTSIFNGLPHLAGHRFAVIDALSSICVHNSLEKIVKLKRDTISEEQLKDAVRFARDFLIESLKNENNA